MSWIQKPKYPLKDQLLKIEHHDNLPQGTVEIARIVDNLNYQETVTFVRQSNHLSILKAKNKKLKNGNNRYRCAQTDFPLGVLTWFSDSLENFRKPPAQGGLHAGAMTSADEDVEGEMLCIQRAMDAGNKQQGYIIVNRSRKSRLVHTEGHFMPQEIVFAENFLYQGGLLDLIKDLGERYRLGEI